MKMPSARALLFSAVLVAAPHLAPADEYGVRLINGKPVEAGTYTEVIKITTNGAACTATVVGPRVIITAAHCANNDATSTFTINGANYSAKMKRSSLYPGKDHDVALGVTTEDIKVKPVPVGGKAVQGNDITLLGFGCTNPGGTGGNDGILRVGNTTITGFTDFEMISRKADGAALCFGDSGGPAFTMESGKKMLLGINSKGNIKDTNWNTRIDLQDSQDFLKGFASANSVVICGINGTDADCGGGPPPPIPPTCTLAANPKAIKLGASVNLTLMVTGNATSATIEGQAVSLSNPMISVTPSAKGFFTAKATVSGPGGSSNCQDSYQVNDDPPPPVGPTCSLAAIPSIVNVGEKVTLELSVAGNATSADIDGTPVSMPLGKKVITTTAKGTYNARGNVSGPGGSNSCYASYTVEEGITPPPGTPNLALVPTYCGENNLPTQVRKVCLAVVKKDSKMPDLRVQEALLITYQDQTREAMPVISRRLKPKMSGDTKVMEEMTLYANTAITSEQFQILDSREAILTKLPMSRYRDGEIPTALEGRSAKGQYFIIEKLSPYAVSK